MKDVTRLHLCENNIKEFCVFDKIDSVNVDRHIHILFLSFSLPLIT